MSKHFRVAGRLFARLAELGVSPAAVLRGAGLPAELAGQPRALLTTEELFALWRSIGLASSDPLIGLRLGAETSPKHFDPISLAALSAANLGEAVHQIARYKQLSCPEEIHHQIEDGEWSIHFRWLLASEAEPAMLTDLCFAWVLTLARHGTGTRLSPLRVEYLRPPDHQRILERHFGCPVVFNSPRNALIFRASDAARPFLTGNADLLAMLAPQLDEQLRQHRGEESFAERVRSAIQRRLAGRRPQMREVARELHISSRTLQRRLQDAGSSFQQLLEEARHQLACHYLRNSLLELSEAAYLLGYEDANSFVRAFRTWEGVPPAHWRETRRSAPTG